MPLINCKVKGKMPMKKTHLAKFGKGQSLSARIPSRQKGSKIIRNEMVELQ